MLINVLRIIIELVILNINRTLLVVIMSKLLYYIIFILLVIKEVNDEVYCGNVGI